MFNTNVSHLTERSTSLRSINTGNVTPNFTISRTSPSFTIRISPYPFSLRSRKSNSNNKSQRQILKMSVISSNFAELGRLYNETIEAYNLFQRYPNTEHRKEFYEHYFLNVVPWGVHVKHIPADRSGLAHHDWNTREEIRLLMPSGKIFMSGLVSREYSSPGLQSVAGDEAYTHWKNEKFAEDGRNWRFFTGQGLIKFFNSYDGREWDLTDDFDPVKEADSVAAFLKEQYMQIPETIRGLERLRYGTRNPF